MYIWKQCIPIYVSIDRSIYLHVRTYVHTGMHACIHTYILILPLGACASDDGLNVDTASIAAWSKVFRRAMAKTAERGLS